MDVLAGSQAQQGEGYGSIFKTPNVRHLRVV